MLNFSIDSTVNWIYVLERKTMYLFRLMRWFSHAFVKYWEISSLLLIPCEKPLTRTIRSMPLNTFSFLKWLQKHLDSLQFPFCCLMDFILAISMSLFLVHYLFYILVHNSVYVFFFFFDNIIFVYVADAFLFFISKQSILPLKSHCMVCMDMSQGCSSTSHNVLLDIISKPYQTNSRSAPSHTLGCLGKRILWMKNSLPWLMKNGKTSTRTHFPWLMSAELWKLHENILITA